MSYGQVRHDETDPSKIEVQGTEIQIQETGSTGTDLFSGYLFEEYLEVLQGRKAADTYDMMRRSDPKVKMTLSAMKNPIKGATWDINEDSDSTREGEIQKAFIEHVLFSGLGKTWKSFLHEALSCIDFGYSLFEVTYSAVLNDDVWGSYNGIRSLAFRSQRTIERWCINRHGELDFVEQQAHGDFQKNVNIPAKYLIHFALEKEGDNFEGISTLRPAYGPWKRKNEFLKYIAAGIQKYAIPIPILTIPAGKQGSKEHKLAMSAMKKYVSHQCNYLTVPAGWELKLQQNPFDASKIREVVDKENVEIVNAALANFLELGQSGSGSYALSFDLSDFFLGGLEYVAEQICETINQQLIPNLIKLNFPNQKQLVSLSCSGISDRAGEELSKVILNLVNAGAIKPDDRLEENLRTRFGLTEMDKTTSREKPVTGIQQLSEKKPLKKKSTDKVKASIEKGSDSVKKIMQDSFKEYAKTLVSQAVNHRRTSSKNAKLKPIKDYKRSGIAKFKKELTQELSLINNNAIAQVRSENKRFANIKLSEKENRILLAEEEKVSPTAKARISGLIASLVLPNVEEIEKTINLQYSQSVEKLDSDREFAQKLEDAANKKIDGPMTTVAALTTASTILNRARADFFGEMQKTGELKSFTWVNTDPVSEICKGLTGRTLPAGHPDVDKFWPPLHHNCKTYVTVNTSSTKGNPEPQNGFIPNQAQAKSITLADE